MSDKKIVCVECGGEFTFTESEQLFFKERGFQEPKRCQKCRQNKKIDIKVVLDDLSNLLSDLDFEPEVDFDILSEQNEKATNIVIKCKSNDLSRVLLYDGGDLAGAFRKIVKSIGRRRGVFLNIDVRKPEGSRPQQQQQQNESSEK